MPFAASLALRCGNSPRFARWSKSWGADWSRWPAEFSRPDAPGIARFEADHARRVEFHEWLQWLTDVQLAAAGATLPVLQDMPIGIATPGADAWTWQDVLADGVSVGAPPDMYNTQGQNWGIPPWAPRLLEQAKYEPFVQTIRALLRHAGGLRIDHVMGLFRLFWIPQGTSPIEGTYVEYPAEDLLNIVALESHRAGAFVVGEDLGTVGKNVRRMLADARILSNRLLWFESQPPSEYPRLALAAGHDPRFTDRRRAMDRQRPGRATGSRSTPQCRSHDGHSRPAARDDGPCR